MNPTNGGNQGPTQAEVSQSAAPGWAANYEPPLQAQIRPPVSFVEDLHPQYDPARFARSAPVPTARVAPTFNQPAVTVSHTSAPLQEMSQQQEQGTTLGMFCPGLEPMTTMLPSFKFVVDYRMYRLQNPATVPTEQDVSDMYVLKKRIDSLYSMLMPFSGEDPIEFLNSITMFKEAIESFQKSEAVTVRMLTYYLIGDAREAYENQVSPGTLVAGSTMNATWPHVVHMFLQRYLNDEVLQSAYD